jgi:hypothetical protein
MSAARDFHRQATTTTTTTTTTSRYHRRRCRRCRCNSTVVVVIVVVVVVVVVVVNGGGVCQEALPAQGPFVADGMQAEASLVAGAHGWVVLLRRGHLRLWELVLVRMGQ